MIPTDIGTEDDREVYITRPTEVPQEQPNRLPEIVPTEVPVEAPVAP